ncbi:MAG: hypothetical protein BKP49_00470 [Treponema sp. CETP13]|nr:MAG: hypothetical protein BKP49_00470 [Treponema sp. CETP13]
MSRPKKSRRVGQLPRCTCLYPQQKITLRNVNKNTCFVSVNDVQERITMTVDEYETIRLIDYKNLTQEECATQMDVARTTITAMYTSARNKIAKSIVESRILEIVGGNYMECQGRFCHKLSQSIIPNSAEDNSFDMKLAVPCKNNMIFQQFGITKSFKFYTIRNGKIESSECIQTENAEHKALINFLINYKIDSLLCGGIGQRAKEYLLQAGIVIYSGVSGNADLQVQNFLEEKLNYFLDFPTDKT